jgi:hypothetical protein
VTRIRTSRRVSATVTVSAMARHSTGHCAKLAPGRCVEERLPHGYSRAATPRPARHDLHFSPARARGRRAILHGRQQLEARYRRDGRERLATKAVARDSDEVFRATDLRRGVPGQREDRVIGVHADAIVADSNEGTAAVLDLDVERGRAGVQRVLHELLDR